MSALDISPPMQPAANGLRSASCSAVQLPAPYYDEDGITIYCADNRQILPLLGCFDLLMADPPYGIGEGNKPNGNTKPDGRWKGRKQREYYGETWDDKPAEAWVMGLAQTRCQKQIIWGGNYYHLPPARCWLVWDKLNGENSYADCELAWTNLDKAVRRKVHQWQGMIRKGAEDRHHPTQKPLEVIQWAIQQAGEVQTILDPWAGSGTTGHAAKNLGMRAVLIEREERYCEVAVQRLAQGVLWRHNASDQRTGRADHR